MLYIHMKNKKILKTIVIILLLFLIIFGIYIIRNYIILKKISKLSEQTNTYSFVSKYHQEFEDDTNSDTTFECYYKDEISKIIIKDDDGNDYCIEWYNKNTDEYINVFPKDMIYGTQFDGEPNLKLGNVTCPFLDLLDFNYLYVLCPIRSNNINGEKCYLISSGSTNIYINKENGNIIRYEGEGRITDYTNIRTVVTDEEISKPDITGYKNKEGVHN